MRRYLHCTPTELTLLRPLDGAPAPVRRAVTRWLWEHGTTPAALALGRPLQRRPDDGVLVWHEDGGDDVGVRRWRFAPRAPHAPAGAWPAAFPDELLRAGAPAAYDDAPAAGQA
ncbi:hypothetical protein [Nocardioides litoris]|uniref:hypothetical protein n=1 Tax=Nocardioides litoris TaxID=1926648 RepID=UPI00111CEA22|nr:hypothetical protein [Nocardioides litoris]